MTKGDKDKSSITVRWTEMRVCVCSDLLHSGEQNPHPTSKVGPRNFNWLRLRLGVKVEVRLAFRLELGNKLGWLESR